MRPAAAQRIKIAGTSETSTNGREGLHAALKAPQGMALVTCSISRLARSNREMRKSPSGWGPKVADVVNMTKGIDTSTAAGRMVYAGPSSLLPVASMC